MLSLKGNQVSDITPIEALTDLQFLFLDKNPVADLAPLHRAWKKDNDGPREWAPYCQIFLTDCPLNDASKKLVEEMKKAGARITP
jgi:Leucine-rich repeat (LRR) protein